ncbi:MAG TPA: NUDIX hydrolase [Ktedonobacteraceae bacterium]|nr:NUDIX hydrolase [Ktedonobacteraceae bacterium]
MNPKWLQWAKALQAMAQTGLTYAKDPYDIERYTALREIAFEIMEIHSDADIEQIRAIFQYETGYANPKVDVRAAIFRDDTILLVKERSDGGWTLPGGWADVGDSPSESAVREAWEESGYRVRATRLLAVYDRDKERHGHPPLPYQIYKLFFECEIIGGAPTSSSETDGVAFFSLDDLPPLSLTRITPVQIKRLFELHQQPELGADFD